MTAFEAACTALGCAAYITLLVMLGLDAIWAEEEE